MTATDSKISALTELTSISSADYVPIVDAGDLSVTKRATLANIFAQIVSGSAGYAPSNETVATDPIWDAAGDIVYGTGANTAARLPIGTATQVLTVNTGATAPEWADATGGGGGGIGENILINGDFVISQRETTFTSVTVPANSDDTYLIDRWVLLSDGNDIVDVSQVAGSAGNALGSRAFAKFDIETEDKKWGILQIVKFDDSAQLIGGSCSLSFKAARGASDTSTLLRAAVLSWSGTADTVTSDVVSAWGNEGTSPTLVAGWTYEDGSYACGLTDAWQTFKVEGIAIDTANTSNIAVFIWSDDKTNAVGDLVHITDVKLEKGATCTDFIPRPEGTELQLCQQYYETNVECGIIPKNGATLPTHYFGGATSSTNVQCRCDYAISKFKIPTITFYRSSANETGDNLWDVFIGGWTDSTATSITASTKNAFVSRCTGTYTSTGAYMINGIWTAESEL